MARVVGMMQDTELAVAALAVQVELALLVLIKVHTPAQQFLDLGGSLGNDLLHGLGVAEPVASDHRVVDMLVKVVHFQIGHCGHTTLSQVGVGLFHLGLAHQGYGSRLCHLQGKTHTGYTRADDEVIISAYHTLLIFQFIGCTRASVFILSRHRASRHSRPDRERCNCAR